MYVGLCNLFVPDTPFLYPLKTSENLKVFWYFQGVKKGCIGDEWVKFFNEVFCSTILWVWKKGTVINITPYLQHLNLQEAKVLRCKYLEDFLWYGKNIYHSDLVVENIHNETTQSNLVPQLNTFNFIRHLTDF